MICIALKEKDMGHLTEEICIGEFCLATRERRHRVDPEPASRERIKVL